MFGSSELTPAISEDFLRQDFDARLVIMSVGMASLSDQSTVVGGVSAFENGGSVVLLDKSFFCGEISTKKRSGTCGAHTRTQRGKGTKYSAELFKSDPLKGGAKKPEGVMRKRWC